MVISPEASPEPSQEPTSQTSSSGLHLREITPSDRAVVAALTVTAEQSDYVAGVAESLVEADETPDACPWYRAIYDGDLPVGFVMISDGIPADHPEYLGPYYLWRLLVDHRYQGRGYGSGALALVVDYLVTHRPDARVLITSTVQGPRSPIGFYLGQGFRDTGTVHDDERVLELDLPRPTRPD